ncbi:lamin tail domain-containing protein [Winogradskyella sp. UBA3174]|mgnify:CR=1 FL=1|uniref:lamin tail domain-containing protein n=1 Tax=Winogradskyella sp. UBA3174 TaxID=1947785 RepID=UPI0025CEED68|nr:lamin tail domain-containing protein [Winogradskyella sp. UBA3174]|tara:strand:+ start:13474 stop:15174 length:1701 start_codon:yes stop_codon:yes gene_type:complete
MKKLYILFLLCSFIGFSQSPGDIVITEIMNNPNPVSDTTGEWFEIFNTTGSDIDINGWTLQDDGTDTHVIDNANGTTIVSSGGYLVLGRTANTVTNGGAPVDYAYGESGGHTLGNGTDEVVLVSTTAVEIARVIYDNGATYPDLTGASMQLDPTFLNETDNDTGANWCASTSTYGDGTGSLGTPGSANDACAAVCEANLGASDATCDSIGPGATDDTYTATLAYFGAATGENFLVTATSGTVDLSGGNDPTTDAAGIITVTGVAEGTDITITVDNTADGGLCTFTRDITSPVCLPTGSVDLELQGIIDFTVPSGGSDGKAIHLVATADITDLSEYGLGIANNGDGSDGQEYTLDAIGVSNGDNILVVRSLAAMEAYFTTPGYNLFEVVILDAGGSVSQNGDDAIELYKLGALVETFGDVNCQPNGGSGGPICADTSWEYTDSWAYKTTPGTVWPAGWTYGTVDCTDGSATTFESSCVYPFVLALSNEDFTASELSIYPNPTNNGIVNIKSQIAGVKTITLFDIMGRNVLSTELNSDVLDVSSVKTGMYLLQVSINGRSSVTKLVIK